MSDTITVMITSEEANRYKDQLHPAYAGYLHDSAITDKDVVASIFHLIKTGVIVPEFKDHNMNRHIVRLRLMAKKPRYAFEATICQALFDGKKERTTKEVLEVIQSKNIHHILKNNVQSISQFPLIKSDLKFLLGDHGEATFTLNGAPVTTVELANEFNNKLTHILLPIFIALGVLFLILAVVPFGQIAEISTDNISVSTATSGSINPRVFFSWMSLGFIAIPMCIYLAFSYSKKVVSYKFEKNIVPFAKKKYDELYTYLKKNPMNNHNVNNEFLAYSIAFGIDRSWNGDFLVDEDVTIESSMLGKDLA